MKYITGGFVGEEEAGMRLFQVAHDPRCSKSGVYWSWNGGPREGRDDALETDGQISGGGGAGGGWDSIYENDQSDKVLNVETSGNLWKYSTQVTGAKWPPAIRHVERVGLGGTTACDPGRLRRRALGWAAPRAL